VLFYIVVLFLAAVSSCTAVSSGKYIICVFCCFIL
jgi:hypothetical protein